MPMLDSQGQLALSDERLSMAGKRKKKKSQQNPFLTGLKICSYVLRGFRRQCATVPSDGLIQKGKRGD